MYPTSIHHQEPHSLGLCHQTELSYFVQCKSVCGQIEVQAMVELQSDAMCQSSGYLRTPRPMCHPTGGHEGRFHHGLAFSCHLYYKQHEPLLVVEQLLQHQASSRRMQHYEEEEEEELELMSPSTHEEPKSLLQRYFQRVSEEVIALSLLQVMESEKIASMGRRRRIVKRWSCAMLVIGDPL
ncbi:hypothetical protein Ahy_B09g094584 isoform C [Arachis hypogaea]|uniref:Uncharacterized protein n=1 Tax=Arachis hypogaea TaxID=3818 RepID=A0A444XBM8_ARAHY|nr:hypothetical protein Ahy_B09g094584 isoform C [Arachis hypogaea]